MPFSTLFHLDGSQNTYPCFPGALFRQILRTVFFPSYWLLSHVTTIETIDRGERGINPVARTIINPCKEYWLSCRSQSVLKSCMLSTELWVTAAKSLTSGLHSYKELLYHIDG